MLNTVFSVLWCEHSVGRVLGRTWLGTQGTRLLAIRPNSALLDPKTIICVIPYTITATGYTQIYFTQGASSDLCNTTSNPSSEEGNTKCLVICPN